MTDEKLKNFVNSSGFPLQIGLEHHINKSSNQDGWKVLYKEYPWKNTETNESGFIDLVLTNRYETSVMVVECKRVQNSNWIFLMPSERQLSRRHARAWVSRCNQGDAIYFDWTDINADYPSPESSFCIVPGQSNRNRPMLERLSAEVTESTEAFAKEDFHILNSKVDSFRVYFNVIVTTAELNLCSFNPENISIENGLIEKTSFTTVPFLRFRKSLSTKSIEELNLSEINPYNLSKAKENTIFVVSQLKSLIGFSKPVRNR